MACEYFQLTNFGSHGNAPGVDNALSHQMLTQNQENMVDNMLFKNVYTERKHCCGLVAK